MREACQPTLAGQDSARRKRDAFARAWRAHLASLLGQATVDLTGQSTVITAELDTGLPWQLLDRASPARNRAIERAEATRSRRAYLPQQITGVRGTQMILLQGEQDH